MLGKQTVVVNGQMVNTPDVEAYLPVSYAPVAPSSLWASQTPTMVPSAVQAAVGAAPAQTGSVPGMTQMMPPNTAAGWLHPTKYPVTLAIIFLVVGLAILRFVHWRGE